MTEDRPVMSALTRLTPDEHSPYSELVEAGLGDRVRLEQERIDWHWAEQRLRAVLPSVEQRHSTQRSLHRT